MISLALLAACGVRPSVPCALGQPARARALPEEIQLRLALIRRFQCETTCPPDRPPPRQGSLYTVEPNALSSAIPSYCLRHLAAVAQVSSDLLRIYGGCDLCVAQCIAKSPSAVDDCHRNCSLTSLADYDGHLVQLSTLFSGADYGFTDWGHLLEPLPAPPAGPDQPLTCPREPARND